MKSNEVARRQYSDNGQSEFSHRWAYWANNHSNGCFDNKNKGFEWRGNI